MIAYKGFNKDMTCRGFQYEEGKEYTEEKADLCNAGFHACEDPLDCFNYYTPADSVYREVELSEVSDNTSDDSKRVGKTIKIGAELDVAKICNLHFEYVRSHAINKKSNTGYRSAASNTGDYSAASVGTGGSVALVVGRGSKAKAGIGSAICVCERGEWDGKTNPLLAIKAAIVDGENLKADTWYTLKNGEFVEVAEES